MHDPMVLRQFFEQQMPDALDLLRQMVEINSWTENRAGVNCLGRFTAECFAPLGFTAQFVPAANPAWGDHLILTRPGSGPVSVLMVSHLDTVFPPEEEQRHNFHWQVEGSRIYGPGTHDIKSGTMMMWLVLKALQTHEPALFQAVTWRLLFNAAEESFSPDFGQLCRCQCDGGTVAALVFEAQNQGPDGVPRLVVARKGRVTWRVRVIGRGAHAGSRHPQGANAIAQLALTIQHIAALTDYTRDLTFNVARVTGGTGLNRVPHLAVAEGEFRAFSPQVLAEAEAALGTLAGPGQVRSSADGYACNVEVELLSRSPPWPRNPATDSLMALWAQTARDLGMAVQGEQRGGLSDGNHLWDLVPTLDGLGPGGDNDHCSERSPDGTKVPEYLDLPSVVPKAMLNTLALVRLVQQGRVRT
jgi:glutamate carboxypeptidase